MKTDHSIYKLTIAAIKRSAINIENWQYSSIVSEENSDLNNGFELGNHELPIFEIKSPTKHTLITTRQIVENNNGALKSIDFESVDDIIFGNFKGPPNKP